MYFECNTWLGEHFICKVNIFKAIIILYFFNNKNNGIIECKHIPKKDIIFTKSIDIIK